MTTIQMFVALAMMIFSTTALAQQKDSYQPRKKSYLISDTDNFRQDMMRLDAVSRQGVGAQLLDYERALQKRISRPRLWSGPFFGLSLFFVVGGIGALAEGSRCEGFCLLSNEAAAAISFGIAGFFLVSGLVWLLFDRLRNRQAKRRLRRVRQNLDALGRTSSYSLRSDSTLFRF